MTGQSRSITISGGTFTNSPVANGSVRQEITYGPAAPTVDDLRAALAAHRDELVALASDDGKLERGLEQLEEELVDPQPDGEIVRGGWKSILKALETGASATESVAKIADLVATLFAP